MATTNTIAALMDKWNSLTAANFPSATRPLIYLDDAPVTDTTGTQEYQPYAIIRDGGSSCEFDLERNVIESQKITLEVYADSLADVDQIVEAAKYNGGTIAAGSGLEFTTLTIASLRVSHHVRRSSETRFLAGIGKAGQRVYGCRIEYDVTTRRTL